jgi:hypothetical protein
MNEANSRVNAFPAHLPHALKDSTVNDDNKMAELEVEMAKAFAAKDHPLKEMLANGQRKKVVSAI